MTKEIYYYELLKLIQLGEQPSIVYYNHKPFYWFALDGVYCSQNHGTLLEERLSNVLGGNVPLVEVERYLPKFKVTYQTDILDKTEKKYIKSVIKPFINNVLFIKKHRCYEDAAALYICYTDIAGRSRFILPTFSTSKESDMYTGMELGKEYTLEELNLWEGES